VAEGHHIIPCTRTLTAANGTEIRISGETLLNVYIGNLMIPTPCLVSEFVDEVMLGLEWMEANNCIWNFRQQSMTIEGNIFQLFAHNPTWGIRRVVLSEPVVLKPRTQHNVKADVVFANLAPTISDWVTKISEPQKGVRVARTVVNGQANQVQLRMINTNPHEVQLLKGVPLCRLEEGVVLGTKVETVSTSDGDSSHLETILESVDKSVSSLTSALSSVFLIL